MDTNQVKAAGENAGKKITTYHETVIDNHLFRVTSVYLGKVELTKVLEDLAISKILKNENIVAHDTIAGKNVNFGDTLCHAKI